MYVIHLARQTARSEGTLVLSQKVGLRQNVQSWEAAQTACSEDQGGVSSSHETSFRVVPSVHGPPLRCVVPRVLRAVQEWGKVEGARFRAMVAHVYKGMKKSKTWYTRTGPGGCAHVTVTNAHHHHI